MGVSLDTETCEDTDQAVDVVMVVFDAIVIVVMARLGVVIVLPVINVLVETVRRLVGSNLPRREEEEEEEEETLRW